MSKVKGNKKKFSPTELFEELLIADFDPSIFDTIDDREFAKAPNFFEWVIGPQYLNTKILPKQVEIGVKMFADYCPKCSNPGYIDTLFDQSMGNILDNIVFLDYGKCPKCAATRYELVESGVLGHYNELVGAIGQRAGKSKLVGLVATYITHRFLKISNPLRYFGQPTGELLVGTFSGMTLESAAKTLWESYRAFMESSPWFQQYHKWLKEEGKRIGYELFHVLKTSILYSHKQMLWHCTGSQDRKMRGATRIFAAIDELGWFISDDNKTGLQNMNADAVYTSLTNSLTTMRIKQRALWHPSNYDVPPIIMANTSSPSSAKDKIMRLYKESMSNPRMLGYCMPTWSMNPDMTYEILRSELSVTEEDLMRDFGAEPPLASNPFLSDTQLIDKIAQGNPLSQVQVLPIESFDSLGSPFKAVEVKILGQDKVTPRVMTFDLGYTKNGLACCVFSMTSNYRPKLDLAFVVMPEKGKRVNITHVFEKFTLPMVEAYNIRHVFFDRWQSLDQIERLKERKVDARVHSLTYKEMDSVRGTIISEGVVLPKLDKPMAEYVKEYVSDAFSPSNATATLGLQLLTVRDMGHRMSKPLVGDDDLFRAFCLGVVMLNEKDVKVVYRDAAPTLRTGHSVTPLGMVRARSDLSGGYGGGGMSGGTTSNIGMVRSRSTR